MGELFGEIALNFAEGAAEFASSGGSSNARVRLRYDDQRIPCSLSCFGPWEIIQQASVLVVCIATLIVAAMVLAILSSVEEYADSNGRLNVNPDIRYLDGKPGSPFDAEGSRGAAGYLIFACCAGIVYHLITIFVRVYYICADTTKLMNLYFVLVNLLVVFFGISFFAGAIANIIFFVDNNSLSRDCIPNFAGRELCQDLDRLASHQIASFALSITLSVLYPFLWLPTCLATCRKAQDDKDNRIAGNGRITIARPAHHGRSSNTSTGVHVAPRTQENAYTPSNASTNAVPFISKYASPSVSKDPPSHTSTAYTSTEPPSYETAIADTVEQ